MIMDGLSSNLPFSVFPSVEFPFIQFCRTSTIIGTGFLLYWFIRWLPTAQQSDQLPAHFSAVVRTLFLALTAVSIALVEAAIIYLSFMTRSRFMHGHFLIGGMIFSALLIILFFVGIYCLAWMIAFYKTIRRVN
jgi:hypothetical protein